MSFTPSDTANYNNASNKTYAATVKTVATIPTASNSCKCTAISTCGSSYSSFAYTGAAQTLTTATSGTGYTLSGYSQTNVNTSGHTITATLADGYIWSDNATGTKTFKCYLPKATPTITLSASSGSFVAGNTKTFTATVKSGASSASVSGTLTASSGTTSVATVAPTSTTITNANNSTGVATTETITGVAEGSSTITMSFTPSDTTNYKSASNKTYAATVTAANYQNTNTNVYYNKLNDALNAVASNQTIKVLQNVNETNSATLASGTTAILNLNGKTITSSVSPAITNAGTLDIYSSASGGILSSSSTYTITNTGTLTTNNTSTTNAITIRNTSSATGARVINNSSTSGKVTLKTKTTITFNTATSGNRYLINNSGTLTISGATLNNKLSSSQSYDRGIYLNNAAAKLTISSGTISTYGTAIYNYSSTSTSAITINGGSITSTNGYGIEVGSNGTGKIKMTAGSISGVGGIDHQHGTTEITGGTVIGTSEPGYENGAGVDGATLIMGTDDGVVHTDDPVIMTTGTSGVYGVDGLGSFYIYDGEMMSSSGAGYAFLGDTGFTIAIEYPTDYYLYRTVSGGIEDAYLVKEGILRAGASGTGNFLNTSIAKSNIKSITFTNSLGSHTANGSTCWDVSRDQDGTVLAWVGTASNGKYPMTIGANGIVYASSGEYLFNNLTSVTSYSGLQYLSMIKTTNMHGMFSYNTSLTTLNLNVTDFASSTWKITNMKSVFYEDTALTSISINQLRTDNVTNMEQVFARCTALTQLDLNGWNVSSVTTFEDMFHTCTSLTALSITSWVPSAVTNSAGMFTSCNNLRTIYGNTTTTFNKSTNTSSANMFLGCTSIVGGNGTTYNSSIIDKTRARLDVTGTAGYFTKDPTLSKSGNSNNTNDVNSSETMSDEITDISNSVLSAGEAILNKIEEIASEE